MSFVPIFPVHHIQYHPAVVTCISHAYHYINDVHSCIFTFNIYQIRAKGLEVVTKLSLGQFYTLFTDQQLWTFEV